MRNLICSTGRVGAVLPSQIATDDTTKLFFADLTDRGTLAALFSFSEIRALFVATDSRSPFCLFTLTGSAHPSPNGADFVFFADEIGDLADTERHFVLSADDIALLNPNTRTCAIFRSRRDAEITKTIYRRVPVLIKEGPPEENPWGIRFMAMFHMANDSGSFRIRKQLEADGWKLKGNHFEKGAECCLPLYEAKMIRHFNHRSGDYADYPPNSETTHLPDISASRLANPDYVILPRYWIDAAEVEDRLQGKWNKAWLFGWRDICRSTDERTVICSLIPLAAVGDKFLLIFPSQSPELVSCLAANLDAFALDYIARQKLGGTSLKYFTMKQLPLLVPSTYQKVCPWSSPGTLYSWLIQRVIELTYAATDLQAYAGDCAYHGPPFRWDDDRRFLIRCELDAAFFHLYEIGREDADYIMDTFPIVRRKDETKFGDYRTKCTILEIYDAMSTAIRTGQPYQTRLDPHPGPPESGLPEWYLGASRPVLWPSHIHPPRECYD
jgi:hypothetical protein